MLNYWRTTGATGGGGAATFLTGNSIANNPLISAASTFSDYGFDGPFFDLEFTLSNPTNANDDASETSQTETGSGNSSESDDEEMREIELNFDVDHHDFKIPPSYKSPLHPPSLNNSQEYSKFPVSLRKTAAKFRVLFNKPNSPNGVAEKVEKSENTKTSNRDNELLKVKFKVDEIKGPLISLFARDYTISEQSMQDSAANSEYLGKEMLQKYFNILKPLYVRVEKIKSSGGAVSPPPEMAKAGLRGGNNLQAGFKVVRKHLGKSRSTSAVSPPGKMVSNRRDDSLLEVQDGIQGAILHCKRSFNSNRERELSRSVSDAYCEKSVISSASYSGKVVETGV